MPLATMTDSQKRRVRYGEGVLTVRKAAELTGYTYGHLMTRGRRGQFKTYRERSMPSNPTSITDREEFWAWLCDDLRATVEYGSQVGMTKSEMDRAYEQRRPDKAKARKEWLRSYRRSDKGRAKKRARDHKRRAMQRSGVGGCKQTKAKIYELAASDAVIPCYYCGKRTKQGARHVDHMTPISRGGLEHPHNLCIACPPCNLSKNDKTAEEFTGQGELSFSTC